MLATLSDAMPLSRALREWFPPGRTGHPVQLSTGIRWKNHGILSPNGERVKLSAIKVGGVFYVRREDADAFLAALNADAPAYESEADIERRGDEACDALQRLGC